MGVGVVCSTHTRFRHRRLAGRARVRVSSRALTSGHRLPGTACAVVANAHQTLAQGEEEGVPSRRKSKPPDTHKRSISDAVNVSEQT